jgi:DNA-binding NarL/FixJ family response regulator
MVNEWASGTQTKHTAAGSALRLLLADDHEMVRMAMRYALAPLSDSIVWHEAGDAAQVYSILDGEPELDLAIVDLRMPGATGIDWIRSLRTKYPLLPLLVISATEDSATVKVLIGCGVAGFIPKSDPPAVILQAVRLVLAGGTYAPLRLMSDTALGAISKFDAAGPTVAGLTPRQREVLGQLARGLPNKRIARELGMSESTVKVHLLAIYRVLAVRNRTEAVVAAQAYLDIESKH